MISHPFTSVRLLFPVAIFVVPGAFLPAISSVAADAPRDRIVTLRIGATGTLTGVADGPKEKAGNDLLQTFIKEETGFGSDIAGQMSWEDLAVKLIKGQIHVGVFQGYEFAWMHEKHPEVKPLAVGVNGYRYPIACVLTQRKSPMNDFADLRGKTLAIPTTSQTFLRIFVDRQCAVVGKNSEGFFSAITAPENVEDCLDDIVDGKLHAAVVDQASLDAYKRRKPGRFNLLKEVARSQPFPPIIVAYCGTTLDEPTLRRFKESLLSAHRKEKGELLLTLSRLSAFEVVPDDIGRVFDATRKAYPNVERKQGVTPITPALNPPGPR